MKLEEYLVAISNSIDDNLAQEWGVYDNYFIYFRGDAETVADTLEETRNFRIKRGPKGKFNSSDMSDDYIFLNYLKGAVEVLVSNYDSERPTDIPDFKPYNGRIALHVGESENIDGKHWLRSFADCIADVSQVILEQKIPSWYYSSLGWKYLEETDEVKAEREVRHLVLE